LAAKAGSVPAAAWISSTVRGAPSVINWSRNDGSDFCRGTWPSHGAEVAAQAGHGVDVCEMFYARIFEGYDPTRRTSAEQAIEAARQAEGRPMDAIRGERPDR
jgi:hypothetical protein